MLPHQHFICPILFCSMCYITIPGLGGFWGYYSKVHTVRTIETSPLEVPGTVWCPLFSSRSFRRLPVSESSQDCRLPGCAAGSSFLLSQNSSPRRCIRR